MKIEKRDRFKNEKTKLSCHVKKLIKNKNKI